LTTTDRKIRKQRGSRTHGWGPVGQHRASGRRGGKGNAGLMKHKWSWTIKYAPDYFRKIGFIPPGSKQLKHYWINVGQLDNLASKQNQKSNNITLNLQDMGYIKLLGSGELRGKFNVIVNSLSKMAKKKIESNGGTIQSSV